MRNFKLLLVCISVLFLSACGIIPEKFNPESQLKIFFVKSKKESIFLHGVNREFNPEKNKLKQSVELLLAGASAQDNKKHIFSEIPSGTRLLSMKEFPTYIIIDLSSNFVSGGGTLSMKVRLQQLIKTISYIHGDKAVLVYVEGKKISDIGGEGLILDNPVYTADDQIPTDNTNGKDSEII